MNEAFAREYLNGAGAVGRVFSFDDKEPQGGNAITIVGQVRDMLHHGVRERPVPTVYLPDTQAESVSDPVLLVRAASGADTLIPIVRRELVTIDPSMTLNDVRTVRQRFDDSIFLDRLIAYVSGLFAILALVLAAVGVYGVLSYAVAQRTHEIGVRIALGAEPRRMLWLVVRDALLLIAAGIATGMPLALAAARVTGHLLFGVKPTDPLTFLASAGFLLLVAVLAAGVPGHRASAVEPMQALRHE